MEHARRRAVFLRLVLGGANDSRVSFESHVRYLVSTLGEPVAGKVRPLGCSCPGLKVPAPPAAGIVRKAYAEQIRLDVGALRHMDEVAGARRVDDQDRIEQ
jgi:hypothetical protein